MSKFKTPKARELRRRQLSRSGYDKDMIDEIIELEFDLDGAQALGTPLPGKRYNTGGVVKGFSPIARPQKFRGIF